MDVRGSCTNGQELTKELELEGTDGATLSAKIELPLRDGDHVSTGKSVEAPGYIKLVEAVANSSPRHLQECLGQRGARVG